MDQATIVMIHSGNAAIPEHLKDSIEITRKIAKKSRIVFLANEEHEHRFKELISKKIDMPHASIEFIAIESLQLSENTKRYHSISRLDKDYRSGFWFNATNRFFLLADFVQNQEIKNVIHIENDYVLYFDPTEKLSELIQFSRFSVPLDRIRAIPGIVWLQDREIAMQLALHILQNPSLDDMATLGNFCLKNSETYAKPFPTIPFDYCADKKLDVNKYSNGVNLFGGIFDAAAIGQYVGGIHWIHNPSDTTFFLNESSDLCMNDFLLSWEIKDGIRLPKIKYKNSFTAVLGMHMHSKSLGGVSPFNHGIPSKEENVVTGERIQAICELTVGAKSITKFHGRQNIKSTKLVEVEEKEGVLMPPSEELLEAVISSKVIFTYTHLVPYFRYFFAQKINSEFTFVTHNSDYPVTVHDFQLLNHPYLKFWYAQNCEFSHPRLKPLPIGLQNQQWGPEKIMDLIGICKIINKTKLLYANFSTKTHPSRSPLLSIANKFPGIMIENNLDYKTYLLNMSMHKFCLCPRGNGIDTHRFWEAQYLDTIPIIVKEDWTSSYADMPILILDNWMDLIKMDLEKIYISISTKSYRRTNLNLEIIKDDIVG